MCDKIQEVDTNKPSKNLLTFTSRTGKWVFRINEDRGIEFNREDFDYSADQFAQEVLNIIETNFGLKNKRNEDEKNTVSFVV